MKWFLKAPPPPLLRTAGPFGGKYLGGRGERVGRVDDSWVVMCFFFSLRAGVWGDEPSRHNLGPKKL